MLRLKRKPTDATPPAPLWHMPPYNLVPTTPSLSWQPVPDADGYRLALRHTPTSDTRFYHVKRPPFQLPTHLSPGPYRIHLFTESRGRRSQPSTITLEAVPDLEAALHAASVEAGASDRYHEAFTSMAPADRVTNETRRRAEIAAGATHLMAYPSVMLLNIGHLCNIDCVMCPSGRRPDPSRLPGWIPDELEHYLPYLDWLLLSGGEPLIYRHEIGNLLYLAEKHGTKVGIHTNGQLLDRETAKQLASVSISMDAATATTYSHIRRRSSWDRTIFAAMCCDTDSTALTLNFTVMKANLHEIAPFARMARDLAATEITFNVMRHMSDKSLASQSILFDTTDCERALDAMCRASEICAASGIRLVDKVTPMISQVYPTLRRADIEAALLQKKPASPHRMPLWCDVPFTNITLDTRGFYTCCNAIRDLYYLPYWRERHIHDIWNGQALQRARRIIHSGAASADLCHPTCAFYARGGYRRERDGYLWV